MAVSDTTADGSASLEDVGDLAVPVQDVDGDEDHAELDASQVDVDHLDAVAR